jgi:type VI secretion system protein ImpC
MSRSTISTGNIPFSVSSSQRDSVSSNSQSCHILCVADFGATKNSETIVEINRDNFDDIFARLGVSLDLGLSDQPIHFNELDDLHPDFIYDKVDLFRRLKNLKQRLKNTDTFAHAAEEVRQQAPLPDALTAQITDDQNEHNLLDSLLARSHSENHQRNNANSELRSQAPTGSAYDTKALIQQIISPYIEPKADPRQAEYLRALDDAAGELMRKIMHHSAFQQLESSWRSLYMLVKRLECGQSLKLFIQHLDKPSLIMQCEHTRNSESTAALPIELKKQWLDERSSSGASPFHIIIADYHFLTQSQNIRALKSLAELGKHSGATVLTSASTDFAGCPAIHLHPDASAWSLNEIKEQAVWQQWQELRATDASQHLALLSPKFLLRMPYGKKSSPTELFKFEELPSLPAQQNLTVYQQKHPYYLWGNSCWLGALSLATNFSQQGWNFSLGQQQIDNLPLHVYEGEYEKEVTPCAEVFLSDSADQALYEAGFMSLRSVKGSDCIHIPRFNSLHCSNTRLKGYWQN